MEKKRICQHFHDMMEADEQENLITFIKMKIIGRALARVQPISELDTWARVKDKLEKTFKKPITYELAQYELAMIKQRRNESIEDYAERIRSGLEKLNNATQNLTKDQGALSALQTANEKQALQYFEQNIFSESLRIRVDSANKSSLAEAILFAKQKEISLKLNIPKTCDFCKMTGHEIADCRKRNANQLQPGTSGQSYRNNGNPNSNRYTPPTQRSGGGGYNNDNRFGNNRFNGNSSGYGNSNFGNRFNNNSGNTRYGNNYGNNYRNNNTDNTMNNPNNNNNNGVRNNAPFQNNAPYRNNSPPNPGNATNRGVSNSSPSGLNRNNYGNNTRNNFEGGNQRNNNYNNNPPNNGSNQVPTNGQNNRGNIRSLLQVDDQFESDMGHLMTTAAQIHEKN